MADSAYQNALKRRAELQQELATVEQFIQQWQQFAGVEKTENSAGKLSVHKPRKPHGYTPAEIAGQRVAQANPNHEVLAKAVHNVIASAKHPMKRGELVRKLQEQGIDLIGTDPTNTLGTALWRMRKMFVNIPSFGYWLRDRSYPPASYDPATWEAEVNQAARALRTRSRG